MSLPGSTSARWVATGFGYCGTGGGGAATFGGGATGTGRNSEQPPNASAAAQRANLGNFIRTIYSKVGRSGNWLRDGDAGSGLGGKCRASKLPMASTPAIDPSLYRPARKC